MSHKTILQAGFAILALLTVSVTSAQEKKQSGYTVYYLKHAEAKEVARSLEMLLGSDVATLNTTIVPEPRLNALFISAPQETLTQVEQFLKLLDRQQENETQQNRKFLTARLKHASAEETAKVLGEVLKTVLPDEVLEQTVVVPEIITNTLILSGPESAIQKIEEMLEALDQESEDAGEISVFTLKHLSAEDAEQLVVGFIGASVRLSSDARTNSLIAHGTSKDLSELDALLQKLDQPTDRAELPLVVPIELKHITPQEAVGILRELNTSANIAVDKAHDRLLISAPSMTVEQISEILKLADDRDEQTIGHAVQLRLVWLMEDKEQEAEPEKFDADLEKVARVVEKRLGLTRLKKVTQLLVNVEPDSAQGSSQFSVSGKTELDVPFDLEFRGELTGNSQGRPVIDLEIAVVQSAFINNGVQIDKTSASIETKVTAPAGHSVVLGVTSISSTSSVFILQILPADVDLQTKEE